MNNKKLILIIGGLIGIVIILMVIMSFIRPGSNIPLIPGNEISGDPNVFNSPTTVPLNITIPPFKEITNVPTLAPNTGQGLDINSETVKNSAAEIELLSGALPYEKDFTSTRNKTVKIVIPSQEFQEHNWTLMVHIFDLDYEISQTDIDYENTRVTFLEAAQDVFYFLKGRGIDTENLIIQWGDRAYIQERSTEWLR